jgi:hypothetical protein
MTREELIAALETATGPDRLSDAAIARSQGWVERERVYGSGWETPTGRFVSWHELPRYTANIDAALALVPARCDWVVRSGMTDHPTDTRPYAHVMFGNVNRDRSRSLGEAHAATPALALCIAALKAQGGRA